MPAYGEKYAEARYIWRDHVDHGAARAGFVLYGNGTLSVNSAQLTDSDTYRCYVDLPDDNFEVYAHSIIGTHACCSFFTSSHTHGVFSLKPRLHYEAGSTSWLDERTTSARRAAS